MASSLLFSVFGNNVDLSLGISFITNMIGAKGLTDIIGNNNVLNKTMGFGSFASLNMNGIFLEFDSIMALKEIKLQDGSKLKPQAFNVELGYSPPDMPVQIAGKFERLSEEKNNFANRFGGVITFDLFNGASSLALEYLRTDEENNPQNSIVTQLAIRF
jgi:hypothetical protein